MTEDEYWEHFFAALRKGTTLISELTRIPISDVEMQPEDWTTMYTIEDVAKRFNVESEIIRTWIKEKRLSAAKIGGEYMITLAAIKDVLNYDRSRLEGVPWDAVLDRCPPGAEKIRDDNMIEWIALQAEARGTRSRS